MSCLGLKLKKPKSSTLLVLQPLGHGQIMEELEVKNNHQDDINTGLKKERKKLMMTMQDDIQLYMPESHLKNSQKTLEDKKNILEPDIQKQYLNQILVQESTTKETILKPFFNPSLKEISKKLWLPTKTDLQDYPLNSLNGSLLNSGLSLQALKMKNTQKETQEMNSQMTSWKLLQSLQPDTTEVESIKKLRVPKKQKDNELLQEKKDIKQILRTRKFRIKFIDTRTISFLRLCFEAYDTFYNLSVNEINKKYNNRKQEFINSKTCINNNCKNTKTDNSWHCNEHINNAIHWKLNISTIEFRKILPIDKESILKDELLKKFINVPYDLRNEAIEHAIIAYKTNVCSVVNGTKKHFELKERNIKQSFENKQFDLPFDFLDIQDSYINICKNCILSQFRNSIENERKENKKNKIPNTNNWCQLSLSKRSMTIINEQYTKDKCFFKICKSKNSKYYLIMTKNTQKEIYENKKNIISLDPGVRTFQTCYDPSGLIIESGTIVKHKIETIIKQIDNHEVIINDSLNKTKRRKNNKKKKIKKYKKISNIVDNIHNQLSSYLTKNYNNILVPQLPVKKLVRKWDNKKNDEPKLVNRVINSITSRIMNYLSFDKFLTKLKSLCSLRNTKLFIIDEIYTSKTCGCCGYIKSDLGSNKIYKCNDCKLEIDRDYNGARNILLKHLI
jgi:transposase